MKSMLSSYIFFSSETILLNEKKTWLLCLLYSSFYMHDQVAARLCMTVLCIRSTGLYGL